VFCIILDSGTVYCVLDEGLGPFSVRMTTGVEMERKTKVAIGVAGVVIVALAVVVYFAWIKEDDSPAEASLSTNDPASLESAPTVDSLEGSWVILPGDSFVGYRVGETIAQIGTRSEAVGRSTAVLGSMEIEEGVITAVEVQVDMTKLKSDDDRRDKHLRDKGLETNTFPEGSFILSAPFKVEALPTEGEVISGEAVGKLTLHGVTQEVTIPLEGQFLGKSIEIVGSLTIDMTEYGIDPPSTLGLVSVEDEGTIELQLFFVPADEGASTSASDGDTEYSTP